MNFSNACGRTGPRVLALLALAAACAGGPAAAQQPSQEQISAIRQNCRSDYMAHCSSITPGGAEAFQCLERNLSQLSGACRSAMSAAMPKAAPAAPATASAPTQQPAPHPAAAPTSPPPASHTAAPHAPAPHTAAPHSAAPHAPPAPASRPPATAAVTPGAPPPPALIPLAPMPQLPLRVELLLLRICAADRSVHCGVVQPGGGRIIACLADNEPALMPNCKEAMAEAKKYD
jgi:hypothetical protein